MGNDKKAKKPIEQFLEKKNITAYELEKNAGIGKGTIGKLIKNNSKMEEKTAEKIIALYPDEKKSFLMGIDQLDSTSRTSSFKDSQISNNLEEDKTDYNLNNSQYAKKENVELTIEDFRNLYKQVNEINEINKNLSEAAAKNAEAAIINAKAFLYVSESNKSMSNDHKEMVVFLNKFFPFNSGASKENHLAREELWPALEKIAQAEVGNFWTTKDEGLSRLDKTLFGDSSIKQE